MCYTGATVMKSSEITAFVARRVQTRESDLVLSLLTRELGRIDVYARGGRNSRRRFQAGLSTCLLYRGMVSPPKRASLWTLDELTVLEPYHRLLQKPDRMMLGQYATELVREFSPEHSPEPELFDLLGSWFSRLNQNEAPTPADWVELEWRVLELAGVAPQVHACVICQRPDPGSNGFFSHSRGGLICSLCGTNGSNGIRWNPAWTNLFSSLKKAAGTERSFAPGMTDMVQAGELLDLLGLWLDQVLDRPLFSRKYCRDLVRWTTES